MKNVSKWFWVILAVNLGASGLVLAQVPPPSPTPPPPAALPSGEEIIKQSKELLYKIDDQKNKVTLKLMDSTGSQKEVVAWRSWKNYKGADGFSSKAVIYTESPADMRGQTILIWDYVKEGKAEDLWIYLPTLRNTRRVKPQQQDEAFMGSDLTFGDMGQRRLEEDTHTTVGKEAYRGVPCFMVESVPKDKESFYKKKVTWISESDNTIQKIDYYDHNGKLLKRQTIDWQVLKEKENNIYVWKKTDIVNVQNGHKTIFVVSDLKLNIGLVDDDFNERVLTSGSPRK